MPDRVSIDLDGLREPIESYRSDDSWAHLSLSNRVRTMLLELIRLKSQEKLSSGQLRQVICDEWEKVVCSVDIPSKRLGELRCGATASHGELVELARVLPYDTHQLCAMQGEVNSDEKSEVNSETVKVGEGK